MTRIGRRALLLLPLAASACGGSEEDEHPYPPLRYNYLPPIQLNVASIDVQQRFIPAGVPPDVSGKDPASPIQALRTMAKDRLQAFGTTNKATFAILNASLLQTNDIIQGNLEVSLTVADDNGEQLGFAQAHVSQTHTGRVRELRSVLYEMTKSMMDDMNVELEFQVRRNLKDLLTSATAPDTAVQQDDLGKPAR